jgi:hypothetical protein
MTTQHVARPQQPGRRKRRYQQLTVVACTAAALALAWTGYSQLHGHHAPPSIARPTTAISGPLPPAVQEEQANGGSAAVVPPTSPAAEIAVVYLTASPEQRQVVENALADAPTIFPTSRITSATVVVVADSAQEAEQRELIAAENQTRATLGLPEITIVDLRTAGATAGQLPPRPKGGMAETIDLQQATTPAAGTASPQPKGGMAETIDLHTAGPIAVGSASTPAASVPVVCPRLPAELPC